LFIKPSLALLYFTKFLTCAWKLNLEELEIEAYDYIGKYYFYMGEIR
jgi:hypothetical protein